MVALIFVASPFYIRQAEAAFARARRDAAGGVPHAGRLGGAHVRPRRDPGRPSGARRRRGAGLGPRAGRVRRDPDVRRLVPRRHADRAARDLRAVLDRLHGALALSAVLVAARRAPSCSSVKLLTAEGRRARVEARMPLREFALDVALTSRPALPGAGRPSGAGKTTVLRDRRRAAAARRAGACRCGDEVWLDTARGIDLPPERRRCGYVFQDYALFPHLRAWQNVAYGLAACRGASAGARAQELLERFGVAALADARPGDALGRRAPARGAGAGARARARARCCSTSRWRRSTRARAAARDPRAGRRPRARPRSRPLLVTHDFAEAAQLGDEVAVMDRGRIVQRGPRPRAPAAPGVGVRGGVRRRQRAARAPPGPDPAA